VKLCERFEELRDEQQGGKSGIVVEKFGTLAALAKVEASVYALDLEKWRGNCKGILMCRPRSPISPMKPLVSQFRQPNLIAGTQNGRRRIRLVLD
jgi:hypothetical protein